MRWNLVDAAAALYVLWGGIRGFRDGLPREIPRALGAAVAIFTGSSLVLHSTHLLALAGRTTRTTLGFLGAPALVLASFLLVRVFRARLAARAERFCPPGRQALHGAAAGAFRCLALAGFLVVTAGLSGFGPVHRAFAVRSAFGRALFGAAVPAWEALTGQPLRPRPSSDSAGARAQDGE